MDGSESESTLPGLEDESSQLSFLDQTIEDSTTEATPKFAIRRESKIYGSRPSTAGRIHFDIHPSDIIEYEWPKKSNNMYFIQEQIAVYLRVTSFQRKYPEMDRRYMDPEERKFVLNELKLNMPQHLTKKMVVLDAREVRQLMASQYPALYTQYVKTESEKFMNEMIAKQKEIDALSNDKEKLMEMRSEALNQVAEFNKALNSTKENQFFDNNTKLTFHPMNAFMKLKSEFTRPVPYPVALCDGQYTSYYQKFTSEEMMRMPLKTMMNTEKLFPIRKRGMSPPAISVSEGEIERIVDEAKERKKKFKKCQNLLLQQQKTPLRVFAALNSRRRSNRLMGSVLDFMPS